MDENWSVLRKEILLIRDMDFSLEWNPERKAVLELEMWVFPLTVKLHRSKILGRRMGEGIG